MYYIEIRPEGGDWQFVTEVATLDKAEKIAKEMRDFYKEDTRISNGRKFSQIFPAK